MDPRQHNPELPQAIAKIILRMLEKPREKRYQTVTEVIKALAAFERATAAHEGGTEAVEHPRREFAVAFEAIDAGILSPAQLRACIARQEAGGSAARDIASLLVAEGLLSEGQVRQLIERTRARERAHADEDFARRAIGSGLVTQTQIDECLQKHRGAGERVTLARALSAGGLLKPPNVTEILLRQLKAAQQAEDAELLELLRRETVLPEGEIERCIMEQRRREAQADFCVLRQLVVELGMVPASQLRDLLRRKMRAELLDYLAEREKAKLAAEEAIIPKSAELRLAEEEPCPACGGMNEVGSTACRWCEVSIEEALREAALRGGDVAAGQPSAVAAGAAEAALDRLLDLRPGPARPPQKGLPPGQEWEIRLPDGTPSQPLGFGALMRLVREKRIQPGTVLRGPLTRGVWRQARFTPKLCRLFGTCHFCGAKLPAGAKACQECQADPDKPRA